VIQREKFSRLNSGAERPMLIHMQLSLRSKLLAGFGTCALLLCAVGLAGWQSTTAATAGLTTLYEDETAASSALRSLGRATLELRGGAMAGSYGKQLDPAKRAKMLQADQRWLDSVDESLRAYEATHLSVEEAQALGEWRASYADLLRLRQELIRKMDEGLKNPDLPDDTSTVRITTVMPALERVVQLADRMVELHAAGGTEEYQHTMAVAAQGRVALVAFLLFGVVLSAATALLLTRGIVRNVRNVQRVLTSLADADAESMEAGLQAMARGDLTVEARPTTSPIERFGSDEVGQTAAVANKLLASVHETIASYERARASLGEMIGDVQDLASSAAETVSQLSTATQQSGEVVQQVTAAVQSVALGAHETSRSASDTKAAVDQLSQAIDGIARGAGEQARAVQDASATASEMASGIEHVAADAAHVAGGSQQAKQAAERGAQAVSETISGMAEIQQVVAQAAEKVQDLGRLGEKIGAVVETIDDVAEQTNLLALNAAIEAARAGEHGRGFAVVADEVRKLAERSSRETRQIGELIQQVQSGTREAVAAMQIGAARVEQGSARADQAGQALAEIMHAVDGTVGQITDIAEAAQTMAGGARDVVQTMLGIQAVVEENTAATEQMANQAGLVSDAIRGIAAVAEEQSASTEEVSASAEEMSAQIEETIAQAQHLASAARQLRQLTGRFRLDEEVEPAAGQAEEDLAREAPRTDAPVARSSEGRPLAA
jgi:methyl-accepting chemotaxis protein